MVFIPRRVYFEHAALDYPLGKKLWQHFKDQNVPAKLIGSHNRVTGIPGKDRKEAYLEAKKTLVVGVRKTLKFETCRPSAHYQLPLCTSCLGRCEYCYLNTTLGKKPYLRVYVNLDEILQKTAEYIEKRIPEITTFEGAATSDPLPYEPYTGALAQTIEFFGKQDYGRFRFVTKFTGVEPLLGLKHNKRTRFRFSLNTPGIINAFEHATPRLADRLAAAGKVAAAGYPLGILIAPVILREGWQEEYKALLQELKEYLPRDSQDGMTFEIVTHRFTARAKKNILEIYQESSLPMDEENRRFKYGQFGYGKYIYPPEEMKKVKEYFSNNIAVFFPHAELDYIV